jgi:hypothetical protein
MLLGHPQVTEIEVGCGPSGLEASQKYELNVDPGVNESMP